MFLIRYIQIHCQDEQYQVSVAYINIPESALKIFLFVSVFCVYASKKIKIQLCRPFLVQEEKEIKIEGCPILL